MSCEDGLVSQDTQPELSLCAKKLILFFFTLRVRKVLENRGLADEERVSKLCQFHLLGAFRRGECSK